MILVREEQSLRETGSTAIDVRYRHIEARRKGGFEGQEGILLTLGALVLGGALGELEYVGQEELVVGIGSVIEILRALGVELEGILKALQGFVHLLGRRCQSQKHTGGTELELGRTCSSLEVSTSSSTFSSGSTLMAEKVGILESSTLCWEDGSQGFVTNWRFAVAQSLGGLRQDPRIATGAWARHLPG